MTFTNKQVDALTEVVVDLLIDDMRQNPDHWARKIIGDWEPETMVEYLDLDNPDAESAADIVGRLGFDPRGEDAPTIEDGWTEDPDWPLSDWRYEVANDDTRLGYAEWVEHNKEAAEDEKE